MNRGVLALALYLSTSLAGHCEFLTYSQWERESPAVRGAYAAGLFDSLVGFGTSNEDQVTGKHYLNCIVRARMNSAQLADNVRQFASTRPEMQNGSVLYPLINYLIALCGKPPV